MKFSSSGFRSFLHSRLGRLHLSTRSRLDPKPSPPFPSWNWHFPSSSGPLLPSFSTPVLSFVKIPRNKTTLSYFGKYNDFALATPVPVPDYVQTEKGRIVSRIVTTVSRWGVRMEWCSHRNWAFPFLAWGQGILRKPDRRIYPQRRIHFPLVRVREERWVYKKSGSSSSSSSLLSCSIRRPIETFDWGVSSINPIISWVN